MPPVVIQHDKQQVSFNSSSHRPSPAPLTPTKPVLKNFSVTDSARDHHLVTPKSTGNQRVSFLNVVPTILDRLTLTEDLDEERKSLYTANSLQTYPYTTPDKGLAPLSPTSFPFCTPSPTPNPVMSSVVLTPTASLTSIPLPTRWTGDPTSSTLTRYTVSIPSHTFHSSHVTYAVTLSSPTGSITVNKRYTDFVHFRTTLSHHGRRHELPGKQPLPALFNRRFSPSFIRCRSVGLVRFLSDALCLHGRDLDEVVRVKGRLAVTGDVKFRDDAIAEFFDVEGRKTSVESW